MSSIFCILLYLLNYFPLHSNPKKSAEYLPDILVYKIHGEIVEAIHDALAWITHIPKAPGEKYITKSQWDIDADKNGLQKSFRTHRHGHFKRLCHPMVAWIAHSFSNFLYMIAYAEAYAIEHVYRRSYNPRIKSKNLYIKVAEDIEYFQTYVNESFFEGEHHALSMMYMCGVKDPLNTHTILVKRWEILRKRQTLCRSMKIGLDENYQLFDNSCVSPPARFFGESGKCIPKNISVYGAYTIYLIHHKKYKLRFNSGARAAPNIYPQNRI